MAHKKEGNKYWIYGEDAALAARFTKYLTKVLYARRASYIRTKMAEAAHEVSIEECSGEVEETYKRLNAPIEERVEARLMWEGIRNYHDLRHSCASLLIKNKVTMKEVQMWLGHSSFSTSANIYAHIDVDSKMEAANMIASKINLGGLPEKKKSPKRKIA